MADLKKTIDIILNGENRASKPIGQASSSLSKFGSVAGTVTKAAAAAAAAIAAMSVAVAGLIAAGLKEAYEQSVDLETAMVGLEKVLGSQPQALDEAKDAALELSSTYGVATNDIIDSIAGWVQAGYDIEEATILAEDSIALLYASELDAAGATTTLTKIMKGFGLEVDEARGKLDAVNEISNNYATSAGDLTEALSRVAPIAQTAGFSFEEMAAILTPVIEKFQSGEKAGTAYATILNKLVDDSKPVIDSLASLGVSQRDANGEMKSGRDILFEVGEAFQDLDQNQKQFVAMQLVGTEQSGKFLATMGDWDKVAAVYETAMNSAGSVTEEVRSQLESSENIIKVHQESWKNLSAIIGDQYNEAVDEVYKGSALISAALQDSVQDGDFDAIFDALNDLFIQLSDQLVGIAEALPEALEGVDWDELGGSVRSVGEAFGSLFDGLDLSDPEDLTEAIQRIVDITETLITTFGNLIAVIGPLGNTVVWAADLFNQFFDVISDIDSVADFFATAAGMIIGVIQQLAEWIDYIPGIDMSGSIAALESVGTALAASTIELEGAANESDRLRSSMESVKKPAQEVKDTVDGIAGEKDVGVKITEDDSVGDIVAKMEAMQEPKDVPVEVDDHGSAAATAQKIEDTIPPEKKLEIEADLKMANIEKEIAEIEATAKTVQASMEWTAKVNIADAEASMEKFKSAAEATSSAIDSTAKATSDLFATWFGADDTSFRQQWAIEDAIDQQLAIEKDQAELQSQLIQEQIKAMQAKTDAIESGEGLISIQAEGLEPELEAFMWKILEKVQVRANEEASEFLLGI